MASSDLLSRFIREEADACRTVAAALADGRNRTFTFNVFDVTLDFDKDEVRIDDILEADLSMTYPMPVVTEALT